MRGAAVWQLFLRSFLRKSLQTQLVFVALLSVGITAATAWTVTACTTLGAHADAAITPPDAQVLRLRLLAGLGLSSLFCLAVTHLAVGRLLRPLYRIRDGMWQVGQGRYDAAAALLPSSGAMVGTAQRDVIGLNRTFDAMLSQLQQTTAAHEQSKAVLARRTQTVDRLLEFSQSVQAAGKPDQVFATLGHVLQAELGLSGLAVLSFEPDGTPPTTVRAAYPLDLIKPLPPIAEMETAMCPCHRQHLPRHFRPDGSPVRCSLDASLEQGPDHAAYCIPFTLGGKSPGVVHMLLPPGSDWNEEAKQLAQTYVNTAQSALISLHLLNEAEKQSMTDGLTGLFNRRSLDALLQREVALAERNRHALSLVMIDMDQFKTINDTFGHAAGDHMLKAFADCVRITLRKTDLAFRYGGDEFVVALPQTTVAQAKAVVEKLRQAFAAVDFSSAIARLDHQPTLSIGVAERSADNNVMTLPALLTAADLALYDAKSSNRNCIKVYTPKAA
jgi:diguanylate cyclase (GGDEF)-like protein